MRDKPQNMKMPQELTGFAAEEWKRITPLLAGRVSELDQAAIAEYCVCRGMSIRITRELENQPLTTRGSRGNEIPNPLFAMRDKLQIKITALARELGLTPKARGNRGGEDPDEAQMPPGIED